VRVEVLHVRLREQAIAVHRSAEPGVSPARGGDQRMDGGGMNTGSGLDQAVADGDQGELGLIRHAKLLFDVVEMGPHG
jgi:hypothetical protein